MFNIFKLSLVGWAITISCKTGVKSEDLLLLASMLPNNSQAIVNVCGTEYKLIRARRRVDYEVSTVHRLKCYECSSY